MWMLYTKINAYHNLRHSCFISPSVIPSFKSDIIPYSTSLESIDLSFLENKIYTFHIQFYSVLPALVWFILRPCQHDNGYIDGRSQIKVHTDERTQVHSAQPSLAVTHPGTNRTRRYLTSVIESPSKHWSPPRALVYVVVLFHTSVNCMLNGWEEVVDIRSNVFGMHTTQCHKVVHTFPSSCALHMISFILWSKNVVNVKC